MDLGCDLVYASSVLSLSGWIFCQGALFAMPADRFGREPVMFIGVGSSVGAPGRVKINPWQIVELI